MDEAEADRLLTFDKEIKSNGTKFILTMINQAENILEVDEVILYHVKNYSFSTTISNGNSGDSLIDILELSMPRFHELIINCSANSLNIKEARKITISLLGKKEKISKKQPKQPSALSFEAKQQQAIDYEIRLALDACFVLLFYYYYKDSLNELFYTNVEFMTINIYNTLCQDITDVEELQNTINFRNMMKIAMQIIPANSHKGLLLDFVTRLVEGSEKKYITGSGATIETQRRVKIYENEGQVVVAIRPERKKNKHGQEYVIIKQQQEQQKQKQKQKTEKHQFKEFKRKSRRLNNNEKVSIEVIEAADTIALMDSLARTNPTFSQASNWEATVNRIAECPPILRNHSLI